MAKPTIVTGSNPKERAAFRGSTLTKSQARAAMRSINSMMAPNYKGSKEDRKFVNMIKNLFPK